MQSTKKAAKTRIPNKNAKASKIWTDEIDADAQKSKSIQQRRPSGGSTSTKPKRDRDTNMAGKQEVWQPSAKPLSAPTFSADCFETQVQELVAQIAPTAEGDKIVQQLAAAAQKML